MIFATIAFWTNFGFPFIKENEKGLNKSKYQVQIGYIPL